MTTNSAFMSKRQIVDARYARGRGDYERVIRAIERTGKCPFCPDNFKYHREPVLKRRGNWFITEASWPYKNSQHHFLIIGARHKERFGELRPSDWSAIVKLANWAIAEFKIKGGGFVMRFGETSYTGATVCHLHAHIIVPELKVKGGVAKAVNFPIG